jgi:O-antigen/teichoic acid export membrane protein
MQDFDESGSPHFETIARKSVKGIFALVSRTFFVQLLSVFASFVLTIFLTPAAFGIFFVVSAIVVFLNYFQDIGLAASLIQKKQEPTVRELRSTFTIQQILALGITIPVAIFAPQIAGFYKLDSTGLILLYALLFSFISSSLKTIPTVMLERRLDFNKLVIPQIAENVVYNLCLITFAVMGYGVNSFTIAVLARSVVGLVLIYWVQPWPIGIAFHRTTLKKLLSFGIPFQANSFLALVKDDLFNIYIAKVLPLTQVGYIGFGQRWAYMPLRLFMDNIIKVTFPSFSRLQHDKEALKKAIEKTLFLISVFILPVVVIIVLFSPYLIDYIPKYKKWEPAILSLTFFSLSTILSSLSTPLTNILNAVGKVRVTLNFMILWTVLTWTIAPLFIVLYGYNGVGIASFLISFSSVLVFFIARLYVKFSVFRPLFGSFAAAGAMVVFVLLTQNIISSFPLLILEIFLSGLFYVGILYLFAKSEINSTMRFVLSSIRKEG